MSQLQDQVKTGSALDSNQAVGHAATVTGNQTSLENRSQSSLTLSYKHS